MKFNIKSYLRKIFFLPFHIIKFIENLYSLVLQKLDPNGTECYKEELSQKQIDSKINSNLKIKKNYFGDFKEYKSKIYDYNNPLKFYTPTKIASHRAASLFEKEPFTIEWIDSNGGKEVVFLDIGANMGIYSIYYANVFNSCVLSFEPVYRNLDLLARNINLNKLNNLITIIPNPIYKSAEKSFFKQSKNLAGMAEASFGKEFYKKKTDSEYNFQTLSLSLDNIFNLINEPISNIIKIDVDGNEAEVLYGAKKIIGDEKCKAIMVETRESTVAKVNKILEEAKFEKKNNIGFNEFWYKKI